MDNARIRRLAEALGVEPEQLPEEFQRAAEERAIIDPLREAGREARTALMLGVGVPVLRRIIRAASRPIARLGLDTGGLVR